MSHDPTEVLRARPIVSSSRAPQAGSVGVHLDRPGRRAATALTLQYWAQGLAGTSAAIGAVVLVGYVTHTSWMVRFSSGLPPMYPNTAIGLLAAGVSAIAASRPGRWRLVSFGGAAVVAAIGTVGLVLNVGRAGPTWFEELFPRGFVDPTTPVGGRPAIETCVALVLLSGALCSVAWRRHPVLGQALGVAALAVGGSAVVGYLLGVDRGALGVSLVYVGMALPTGLGIALVGAAVVLVRPDVGIVARLIEGGTVGTVTRRATLTVAAAPLVLVGAGVLLAHALPTPELSQSIFSVVQVAVLGAAVLIPAGLLAGTERQLRAELDSARRTAEHGNEVDTVVEAIAREMILVTPDVPGWEVGMRYQPATGHLTGDSAQVHHRVRPSPATLVAVIDIAGHDAYSAVVAYGVRAHIAALWEYGAPLVEIAESINTKVLRRRTIATGVLVAVEHGRGEIHVVNAGHPPPVHLRGDRLTTWTGTGPLFGVEGTERRVDTHPIDPGDLLVVYTDGLIEARSSAGQQLGETTLHRIVQLYRDQSADAIANACIDAAMQHAGARLDDDALVVVARV